MRHLKKFTCRRFAWPRLLLPVIVALMTAAIPDPALADGTFLSYAGSPFYEPSQTAFIRYDAATSTETLSIRPTFHGERIADFAWVVPIPTLPEVAEDDPEIFRQLNALAAPVNNSRDSFWGCERNFDVVTPDSRGNGGVEIIDEHLVGIYRTMTLGADDAGALTDSLTTWGFLHEDNRETFAPLLQDYVADGWYFVTMTIDSTALAATLQPSGFSRQETISPPEYRYAAIQPVRFTFTYPEIIYPLRISSFSTYEDNLVTLYVAAAHRLDFPQATTHYANRITAGELAAIKRLYPELSAELWDGAFVTKLFRGYTPQEMSNDIVLTPADSDAEYLPVFYSGFPVWSLMFAGTIVWWLIRKRRPSPDRSRATDS